MPDGIVIRRQGPTRVVVLPTRRRHVTDPNGKPHMQTKISANTTDSKDNHRAIGYILAATAGIVLMNTCAKMGGQVHGPIEMVCFRGTVALGLLVPYMLLTQKAAIFKTKRISAHLYRALVGNLGVGFVFWAYTRLSMADATALLFAAPLFVTALSPMLLKESVDAGRWAAVLVGFGGILLIVRPSAAIFSDPAALIGLAAAFFCALVDIALRNLGQTDHPLTTVFYFLLIGVLATAPYTFVAGSMPTGSMLPVIMGMGLFAALQQVLKTKAFQLAEASLLAPYTYTSIIWATLTGWFFWAHWPTLTIMIGTVVVIASNLYILRHASLNDPTR